MTDTSDPWRIFGEEIKELHSERNGYCNCCGGEYPCLTYRLFLKAMFAQVSAQADGVIWLTCDCDEFPYHGCPIHGNQERLAGSATLTEDNDG